MERILHLESREEAAQIFGTYDRNLKAVRKATGADVVIRNSDVRIRGPRVSVEKAYEALTKLRSIVEAEREVTQEDLDAILGDEPEGPVAAAIPKGIFRRDAECVPKSQGQAHYLGEIDSNEIVFAIGPAGTGKTFLGVAKAVDCLKQAHVRRIVLVRPAVEAGERLGFLPGDIQAKVNPYLRPIYDSLNAFLEFGQLKRLIDSDVIEICPLAYMRGRTLDEAFVILDEAQNTTSEQMKMFLTRMGQRSKIVVTGDITQIDLQNRTSGLVEVQGVLKAIPGISFVYLSRADIVRHPLVQRVVEAYESRKGKR